MFFPAGFRSRAVLSRQYPPFTAAVLPRTHVSVAVRAALAILATAAIPGMASAQTVASPSGTLDAITVTGARPMSNETPDVYAGGQVARGGQAGILGNLDMMDMPFTETSYTAKLIQDQQARTLGDVLKNDSSVQVGNGYGNQAQTFVIRGFPLFNDDLSFNGLYGILPRQVLPVEMVERVEVFKGANAFLNGAAPGGSGLGGLINIQPKRAQDTPLTRLNLDYASRGQVGGGVDIGRRWGDESQFGIRVNAAYRDGETAVPDADARTIVGTVGLDYRGDKLRVSLDAGSQSVRFDHPRPAITASGEVPDAPSNDVNYGQPWAYSTMDSTYGVVRAEYDLTRDWTTYAAFGTSRDKERGTYVTPTVDSIGNATITPSSMSFQRETATGEVGLRGRFDTGSVGHRINLAYSALNTTESMAYVYGTNSESSNIYDPVDMPSPTWGPVTGNLGDPDVSRRAQLRSFAISDTLSLFDKNVLLTLGARHQAIVDNGYDVVSGQQTAHYDDSITTPAVGLVIRPWETVSLYANYIEGLSKGGVAPTDGRAVNPGDVLAPYRTKQIEAGVKMDLGDFGGSLGFFQLEKPDAGIDPTSKVYGLMGKQRNRGIELNLYGEPIHGLRMLGGVTYIDARLKNTPDGANDNHYAQGVPRLQAIASTEWDVPGAAGLSLQGTVMYRSSQYTSASNQYEIGSWTRVDLGAVYRSKIDGRNVVFRAGVDNVADNRYWATVGNIGQITQGSGRVLKVSMSADF